MSIACRPLVLARRGTARVERCQDCGCLSLHLGPISLRLDEDGLRAVHRVIAAAADRLEVDPRIGWPSQPPGRA